MTPAFALDTNVAVYAFSEDDKAGVATELLNTGPRLSIQVLNEFANVSLRKHRAPWPEISEALDLIGRLASSLRPIDQTVHEGGRIVAERYNLGFYDSLLIAAALIDKCEILFSEDMQHGLVIDGTLTISNPFLAAEPE